MSDQRVDIGNCEDPIEGSVPVLDKGRNECSSKLLVDSGWLGGAESETFKTNEDYGGIDVKNIYDQSKDGVVRVRGDKAEKPDKIGVGSGFFVSPEELTGPEGSDIEITEDECAILTNNHVISDLKQDSIDIRTHDGKVIPAEVEATRPETDAAILSVKKDALPNQECPTLKLSDHGTNLKQGDSMMVMGHPDGLKQTIASPGQVKYDGYTWLDANTRGGNSGGPVLDPSAEVTGLFDRSTSTYSEPNGSSGFIPISEVKQAFSKDNSK